MAMLQPDPYTPYTPNAADYPTMWHQMSGALQASVSRVLSLLISILPGLLAFVLALGVMIALGIFLSWLLRKLLTAARFDDRLAKTATSVADWSPEHSPTALIGRFAFWGCVIVGLVIGILSLDVSYASGGSVISVSLLPYVTRSVGAILLLFAGNIIARFLARTVLIGAVNNQLQYARFLSMGVKWLVLVLTGAMVLEHLEIGGTIIALGFGILFGGIVLTLALAIGLGSRDLVTRSLERTADRTERSPFATIPKAREGSETLRHF
jgi:hypothetical protein